MANVDQLKRLGAVLPPNFRVESGAVGDVLSAAVALSEYGEGLVEASEQGIQAVHDFFHQDAVKKAKEQGLPEPEVQAPTEVAPTDPLRQAPVAPHAGVTQSDFAAFKRELLELLRGESHDASAPTTSAAAERPTPAPAPDATGTDGPPVASPAPEAPAEPGPEVSGPFTPGPPAE